MGDKLPCEYCGREVVVGGISDGMIQWPYRRKTGQHSLILCGDLVRAVQVESEVAVTYYWGVSAWSVGRWRRALSVPRVTEGTRRLLVETSSEYMRPAEVRAAVARNLHTPTARAKRSAIQTGRPMNPKTAAALLEAAHRPKSEDWKRGLTERLRKMWEHPEEHGLPPRHQWTDDEIALLGTAPDEEIAKVLGLSKYAVGEKRRGLGIPGFRGSARPRGIETLYLGQEG